MIIQRSCVSTELGSGSGAVGLAACALGADVILTDVNVYTGMLR